MVTSPSLRLPLLTACLLLCLTVLPALTTAAIPKPEDDFGGFMEASADAQAENQEMREKFERHRIWRETTWGGFAVRQIQAVGDHFSPFFMAVSDLMVDDSSAGSIVIVSLIRLMLIFFCVGMVYFGGYLVQIVIGTEYEIEEEVVVVEDDDDNDDKQPTGKRGSRDKKKRQ